MTNPKLDRRQVLKLEAAAMAAAAGGIAMPALAQNLVTERTATELKWDKAACRFCGTGCSVMVATKDNRVVATITLQPVPQKRQAALSHFSSLASRSVTRFAASAGTGMPPAAAAMAAASSFSIWRRSSLGWVIGTLSRLMGA